MSSLYAKDVVELAISEEGYTCGANKWNKYADTLDHAAEGGYFTGCGLKQNLDFCVIFICWLVYMSLKGGKNIYSAHYFLYQKEPCLAAVVKYAAQYYKDNGAYFTDPSKIERGDQVFFQNSKGLCHTGLVIDWSAKDFTTIEANSGGGRTLRHTYKYSDIGGYVAGFGKPRYDGWSAEDDKPETKAETTIEPNTSENVNNITEDNKGGYKVSTKTGDTLNIRLKPNTSSKILGEIPNNTVIKPVSYCNGDFVGGDNTWYKVSYNGVTGFVSGYYLVNLNKPNGSDTTNSVYKTYRVKTNSGDALRIREKPTTESKQVSFIPYGDTCKVYNIAGGWASVEYHGVKGYSSAQYLYEVK